MRRRLLVLISVTAVLAAVTGSWAYWTTAGSGASSASVGTLNAPPKPILTHTKATAVVEVNWTPGSTLGDGVTPAQGYYVTRNNGLTTSPACGTSPASLTTSKSCTDSSVPDGTYTYQAIAVWNGFTATSSASAPVIVDTTPPTNSLSLTSKSGGGSFLSGSTLYYQGSVLGSFKLQNAVADSGSGPASSAFPALGGTTTGWTHTGSTVSTPAGGPYVSTAFSWTAGTSSSPTETVTGADADGFTAVTALTFTRDISIPTGSITYTNGYNKTGTVEVTFSASDTGSGVNTASGQLKRASATLTSGTCGGFGGYENVGPEGVSSPYNDSSVATSTCYKYEYVVSDNVGNQATIISANIVKVDTVAPTNSLSLTSKSGGGSFLSGSTLYYQGSVLGSFKLQNAVADSGSGPASSAFPALGGTTTGWTHTGSTVIAPAGGPFVSEAFSWTAATSSSPTETVTGADAAGNTTVAPALTLTSDTTAPSGGSVSVPAYSKETAVAVTFSAGTDAGSGVNTASGQLKRAEATYTIATDTCGSFGASKNVGVEGQTSPYSDTGVAANKCYKYEYVVADNVGNSVTYGPSSPVKIDTSIPTGSITYTNGYNKTGTVEVTFSASDTGSGVNTASGQLKRASATLTSGTCGGFGGYENVGPEGVSSPYNDSSVATSTCYKYEYVVSDNVGNQATIISANIVKVDTVAPTNSLSLTSKSGGGSFLSGSTLYYQGSVLGSFKLQNAVADSGSGPASSAFPALGGTTTGWTHTGSTVIAPAGGPFVSEAFSWTAATSSSPTETVTGADAAGNTTVAPALTLTSDTTAPSGGSVSVPAYSKETAVAVTFSAGTDAGSGVNTASGQLNRAEATYTELTDTCGSFGAFKNVAEGPTSPFENTGLTKGKCYEYQYVVADNVGNSVTYGPSSPVKIDATAPEVSAITSTDPEGKTASGEIKNGATLTITFKSRIDPASIGAGCPGSCVITGAKETRTNNENVFLVIPGITTAGGSSTGSTAYLSGITTATATFTATVAFSSNNTVLTVTVSELAGSTPAASEGKLKFFPASTITDPAGNAATGSLETAKIKLF